MDSDEAYPVGSMTFGQLSERTIDFVVTADGRVRFTVGDDNGKFIGVTLNQRQEEEFAQHLVAACFAARRRCEELQRPAGMNRAAWTTRDLIGMPDGL